MTAPTSRHSRDEIARAIDLARRRRRRRYFLHAAGLTVNLTPMIDMSFILLIFFVATTKFERPEGLLSSRMPRDVAQDSRTALPLSPIVIRLKPMGAGDDDFSIQIDRVAARPRDFSQLAGELRHLQQQPGFDEETPVVILADDAIRWDHVVGAWNAAVRAGSKSIVFGQPEGR